MRYADYLKVVKTPMDLGLVKRKIEANQYFTPAEFAADFRLVFANAHTYNPPGSDVYVMASTLLVRTFATDPLQGSTRLEGQCSSASCLQAYPTSTQRCREPR